MQNLWNSIFRLISKFLSNLPKEKEEVEDSPSSFEIKESPEVVFEIKDWIKELPWHETRTWSKRSLKKINKIIIHQSLTTGSLESINKYHITPGKNNHITEKGAPHICYHYAVAPDGIVYHCNTLSNLVWHTKGQNTYGIGVVVLGNFSGPTYKGTGNPTPEQIDSVKRLIDFLLEREDINIDSKAIYGHADFGKENCPGNILYDQTVKPRRG